MNGNSAEPARYDFRDRVAVVTGGARGQGLSHALAFARAGAAVAVLDIGADMSAIPYPLSGSDQIADAERQLSDAGDRVLALPCDIREEEAVRAAFAKVRAEFGPVDILVNNAGVTSLVPVRDMSLEQWRQVVDVNLTGAFLASREVIPGMVDARRGSIVNITSGAGIVGMPEQAHYTAAKHALVGLTKSLALELGPHHVRVNTIAPNVVDSPLSASLGELYPQSLDQLGALYGAFFPLASCPVLQPSDVTEAVCWLVSEQARYVTGITLPIDAGFNCK
ncbi:SDR family NAD(P)-dependent oxidoreductase [Streptomyces varsoviensis]|uniref:SDR family NAD(P)-dependent oxidoreductase n=1 Tax=Streptomyces varsoviensis TaxID=67373 RepID=UPI0033F851DE